MISSPVLRSLPDKPLAKSTPHKKSPGPGRPGAFFYTSVSETNQPHPPEPQLPLLQPPPPATGIVDEIEKPDLMPLSTKSTLISPQVCISSLSTRKVSPPSSTVVSLSFGSSRANPSEGPLQPPCIRATRRAESTLFCSM